MELLLYRLISHIKENMPYLSTVDEDYGQLEALDREEVDMYPITFPAVLIDTPECDWSCIANKSQKGNAKVGVKLIVDCYDDTHYSSGTTEAILERAQKVTQLHKLMQGFRPVDDGELIREKSRFYTWNHGIKVYEALYSIAVTDEIQETVAVEPHKVKVKIAVAKPLP